jgi:hypothetical protein
MSVAILEGLPNLSTPFYMLLECDDALLQRIYQLEADPQPQALFAQTELAAHIEQGPWLMRLAPDSQLLVAYRQAPEQWPGVLLSSSRATDEALAHLRKILVVQFEGERKGVLRYYDPIVASYLFPATEAINAWLGPIEQFVWYGATWAANAEQAKRWHSLKAVPASQGSLSNSGIFLDKAQLVALERQQLEAFAYKWWQARSNISFAQVWDYLQQGIAAGFDEEQSLSAYLDLRASHPQHLNHPRIAPGETPLRLQQLQAWLAGTLAPMESQG